MKHNKNKYQIGAIIIFVVYTVWWLSYIKHVEHQSTFDEIEASTFGILALYGSIVGLMIAKKWGGLKTVLGKALTFFSIGLLGQEIGQLIYDYMYYVQHMDIPYPSIGDAAFFGSVLMYIAGAFYLSKAAGVHRSLKNTSAKLIAAAVPLVLITVSSLFFIYRQHYDTHHPLTVFLDIGYPVGQAIYISLAVAAYLISRKALGGVMRKAILWVIFALFVQYVADFTFVYQEHHKLYISGGYADYLYLLSSFVMTIALIKFLDVYNRLGEKSNG